MYFGLLEQEKDWERGCTARTLLLLGGLVDKGLVDVGNYTTSSNGCLHVRRMSVTGVFRLHVATQSMVRLHSCSAKQPPVMPFPCCKAFLTHLDESVELLVTTDGQLQMAGCDTLHLQVIARHVKDSCKLLRTEQTGAAWEN